MAPNEDTIVFSDEDKIQVDTIAGVLVLFKDRTIHIPSGSVVVDEVSANLSDGASYYLPPLKDPDCFDYYKRTNPEYNDKDNHTSSDFFPL
jgi:hypothetical protein